MKKTGYKVACVILLCAICITLIWGYINREENLLEDYEDGIEQIDIDSIYLVDSKVRVDFSEVLVGEHKETRKLIVSEQEATVSYVLTDSLINKLDFDFMKKTQKVSYTGKGYFVVDLDNLSRENVIEDKEEKVITIQIGHAYLQAIEIDPYKITVGDVKQSLLGRGDIKLTVNDYNNIEKELRNRLEAEFNTVTNGQEADVLALKMVKEIYEPIIKAIDSDYTLYVEFQ